MSTHKSPYRSGSKYEKCHSQIRKGGQKGVTKQALLDAGHSITTIGVVISPSEKSKGDCRGNGSAAGHLYFIKRAKRQEVKGVKEAQRFVNCWRPKALEPKTREVKVSIPSEKSKAVSKTKTVAKAKAKSVATVK